MPTPRMGRCIRVLCCLPKTYQVHKRLSGLSLMRCHAVTGEVKTAKDRSLLSYQVREIEDASLTAGEGGDMAARCLGRCWRMPPPSVGTHLPELCAAFGWR